MASIREHNSTGSSAVSRTPSSSSTYLHQQLRHQKIVVDGQRYLLEGQGVGMLASAQAPARTQIPAHIINLLDGCKDLSIDVLLDLGLVLWVGLFRLWLSTVEELFLF